jgi:hypothetical protein
VGGGLSSRITPTTRKIAPNSTPTTSIPPSSLHFWPPLEPGSHWGWSWATSQTAATSGGKEAVGAAGRAPLGDGTFELRWSKGRLWDGSGALHCLRVNSPRSTSQRPGRQRR